MNLADLNKFVAAKWDEDLVPQLVDYVHGHLRSVVKAAEDWCRQQSIEGKLATSRSPVPER